LCALETGALARARHLEEQLAGQPATWYYDPSLILRFRARLHERRGAVPTAIELLATEEGTIEGRLVPAWLKVRLDKSRLLKKIGSNEFRSAALEGEEVANAGDFRVRAADFRRILSCS
jgi:hypothetical protein